jgi:hypothetical protein
MFNFILNSDLYLFDWSCVCNLLIFLILKTRKIRVGYQLNNDRNNSSACTFNKYS